MKITSLFDEWPQETRLYTTYLFTNPSFYDRCQFQETISDLKIVEIEDRKTPLKQLALVLGQHISTSCPQWM